MSTDTSTEMYEYVSNGAQSFGPAINLEVETSIARSLLKSYKDNISQAVKLLSDKYQFDASEALMHLNLSSISYVEKKREKKVKIEKEKMIPLPFDEKNINKLCCNGIILNHCLYTQCLNPKQENNLYCKKCTSQASVNASGKPNFGDINDRMSPGYVPPNNKKVVPFAKIMKKLNLTREQVVEQASSMGLHIDDSHFDEPVTVEKRGRKQKEQPKEPKEKKSKGRPKKNVPVAELTDNVFGDEPVVEQEVEQEVLEELEQELEQEVEQEVLEELEQEVEQQSVISQLTENTTVSDIEAEKVVKEAKTDKKTDKKTNKKTDKLTKEQKKAAKLAKEQEKADKKAAKEAKEQLKAKIEADKKAAKEAKEQLKAKIEAEKLAAIEAKALKLTKKVVEPVVVEEKDDEPVVVYEEEEEDDDEEDEDEEEDDDEEDEDEEEEEVLNTITVNNKKYKKGEITNRVYDYESAKTGIFNLLGTYNLAKKEIEFSKK